ncbi:hypothetical protein BDB01DRAFT_808947 [Pilobolus umbonatus]|nr:hypothetical protein BDB01DRAFT_808947 [Pilobolus umbonatus]
MSANNSDQLTILRIKRKRIEEPLEALLVQQDKEKRIKRGIEKNELTVSAAVLPTLFRLAETVEEKSFSNLDEAQKLKDRISRRIQPGSRPQTPISVEERKEKLVQGQKEASRKARYRVVNQNRSKGNAEAPPVVQSASQKAAKDLFQMYEAVKEDDNKHAKLFMDDDTEDPDDIMYNFIPMVKEYLTLNEKEEDDDDYVYDVYYQADHHMGQVINTANIGSLVWFDDNSEYLDNDSDSELGDIEDEDSNAEDYYQNDYPEEEGSDEFEDQNNYDLSTDDEDYSL